VKGKLVAIGTEELPIQFISSSSNPKKGDWGNIEFSQESVGASFHSNGSYDDGSILSHCIIQHAGLIGPTTVPAIGIISNCPYLEHTTIRYCSGNGIQTGDISQGTLRIRNVTIEYNGNYGLYFPTQYSNIIVEDSTIQGHSDMGIYAPYGQTTSKLSISNSLIKNNAYYGLHFTSSGSLELINNHFTQQYYHGLYTSGGSNITVIDCLFDQHNDWGVILDYSDGLLFSGNTLDNNSK
jgi:parallel beta-helix repeat protein